jgi:hypothetical protein
VKIAICAAKIAVDVPFVVTGFAVQMRIRGYALRIVVRPSGVAMGHVVGAKIVTPVVKIAALVTTVTAGTMFVTAMKIVTPVAKIVEHVITGTAAIIPVITVKTVTPAVRIVEHVITGTAAIIPVITVKTVTPAVRIVAPAAHLNTAAT